MSYHRDPEVNSAIIRLLGALCTWERNTNRGSTFLLIPHQYDEEMVVARDGKPIFSHIVIPERLLEMARRLRRK